MLEKMYCFIILHTSLQLIRKYPIYFYSSNFCVICDACNKFLTDCQIRRIVDPKEKSNSEHFFNHVCKCSIIKDANINNSTLYNKIIKIIIS